MEGWKGKEGSSRFRWVTLLPGLGLALTSFAATLQAQSQPIDSPAKLPPGIERRWEADRNIFLLRDPKRGIRRLLIAEAVRQSTSPAINPEKPEAVETF